jgi:hypothetical protein
VGSRKRATRSTVVRVEHNRETLLVHISDEDGRGWTTLAIDRKTREWALAQDASQLAAAVRAHEELHERLRADRAPGAR